MNGAITGDVVGSVYEFHTIKQKEFKFLKPKCCFTDDTVMTCAIAKASMDYLDNKDIELFKSNCVKYMQELGRKYPNAGYGGMFYDWLHSDNPEPYNSYGNGGAMRTSPVAFVSSSLDEALALAEAQSSVTHNHIEGIKGAKAITAAMYLALTGSSKEEIRKHIEDNYYELNFTISSIYKKYRFDVSSQGSVPQAIEAFLEGEDFEDSIRNAVCLGGDADTLACMAGAIAECYYGYPEELNIDIYLPSDLREIRHNFNSKVKEFKEAKKR